MNYLKPSFAYFFSIACLFISTKAHAVSFVSGELKVWHPVIVTLDGPSVKESESTFRNYRLDVTFTNGTRSFKVPGFFAADGNAAETSADSGNIWRAIFTPDEAGTWNYSVSLRNGSDIAISFNPSAGTPAAGDGESGSFIIAPASENESGFFAKGKLGYVGEHYGQFAGNKEWFVKAGPGSPEDFFGYKDFDNTKDWEIRTSSTQVKDVYLQDLNGEGLHYYTPHVADWKIGDPTWKGEKGKGIIGALNYLASIGVNALYLIPLTINDDSDNTWPWTSRDNQLSYDVSKLAQWDIVFSHMDRVGISPNYYFCESSNSKFLDNGNMTLKYPIYYRELIARFGYHLGIRFNLGEELQQTCAQQKAASKYLKDIDPYNTIVCGHSSADRTKQTATFDCLLGDQYYDGPNYQLHQSENKDHLDIIMWRDKSATAGKKWIVANDESWGIDNTTGSSGEVRMLTYAWRTFMAGAEGMFQYTAYGIPEIGDITMENFRLIANTQKILISCKNLFAKAEINPLLSQMRNENALVGNPTGNDAPFCLAKNDELYIVYRTSSSNQKPLNLNEASGTFTVKWYDAKNGGVFRDGSVLVVNGGGSVNLGNPPANPTNPWAIVVSKNQDTCANKKIISLSMAGYAGSTVSGSGKYCFNTTASLAANVASDAEFVNWTENGNQVSTANPYIFTVTEDRSLVANFVKRVIITYPVTTTESSSAEGSTAGGGLYIQNQSITVSATPSPCFIFVNWTENDVVVSTYANYTFNVTSERNLRANFVAKIFTVMADPLAGGVVSGEITYVCGAVINVTATPNPDFIFEGWYANDKLISTQLTDDINIEDAFQLKARFVHFSTINNVSPIGSWVKGTTHAKVLGKNRVLVVMLYGEGPEDISAASVSYSGQKMNKVIEKSFFSSSYSYTGAFILNEAGINDAAFATISVTWNAAPGSGYGVTSAFFANVNQNAPIGARVSNGLSDTTITTLPLANEAGDLILLAGTADINGLYTIDNGFTRGIAETSASFGDITSAYKLASGTEETPSLTMSGSMRQTIIGFVLKNVLNPSTLNKNLVSLIRIYPNPASDILNIDFQNAGINKEIKIFNTVGQIVYQLTTNNANAQINVRSLNLQGFAQVQVISDNKISNHKVIIN